MTWGKAVPILLISIVFDLLRFIFEQFWFFGPTMAATACTAAGNKFVEGVCVGTAVITGFLGSEAIAAFGVIMAMVIGLLGWMTIGLALVMTNPRIFKENGSSVLHFALGLFISEIPIIGSVPALTIALAKMYHSQIKQEKEELAHYEKGRAAELQTERQQEQQQIMLLAQARAAAQANDVEAEELAAGQNEEEIPEEVRGAV